MTLPLRELFKEPHWNGDEAIELEDPVPPVAHQGVLVYPVNMNNTIVRNAADGEKIERVETAQPWTYAAVDEQGIVLALGHELWRLNRDTLRLEQRWTWALPDCRLTISGTPLIVGDSAYVTAHDAAGGRLSLFCLYAGRSDVKPLREASIAEAGAFLGPVRLQERVLLFARHQTWIVGPAGDLNDGVRGLGAEVQPGGERGRWVPIGDDSAVLSVGYDNLQRFLVAQEEFRPVPGGPSGLARLALARERVVACTRRGLWVQGRSPAEASIPLFERKQFNAPPCVADDWIFAIAADGDICIAQCDPIPGEQWTVPYNREEKPVGEPVYCDDTVAVYYQTGGKTVLRGFALCK